jgi:hypothetical protein
MTDSKSPFFPQGVTWLIDGVLKFVTGGAITFAAGKLTIGADAELEVEAGATVTGLDGAATFASAAEAKTGTEAAKNISPATLRDVLVDVQPLAGATFTIGAEAAHVINVGIQLEDLNGDPLAARAALNAYLSDDANGDSVVATAPDTVAIGTDGLAIPLVAKKCFLLTGEVDGDIDINITNAAADTFYLVLVMPSGKLVVSGAITHAG